MRSRGRGEHAMAEGAVVAAGARTGSSAGLAKSPWRGIGRRLSWSSQILPSGLDRPTSGHRCPFPHIRSAILKTSQPSMAIPTPQKSMTETTASSYFLHGAYGLTRRMASNKLFVRLSIDWRWPLYPSVGARISPAASNTPELFPLRRQVREPRPHAWEKSCRSSHVVSVMSRSVRTVTAPNRATSPSGPTTSSSTAALAVDPAEGMRELA